MRLPKAIKAELEATGKPWEIVPGKRHYKIKVDSKMVGILPHGKFKETDRAAKNVIAQIRRAGNETQDRTRWAK